MAALDCVCLIRRTAVNVEFITCLIFSVYCLLTRAQGIEFAQCPADMTVRIFVGQTQTSVTWTPPTATTNSGSQVTVTSSHTSGQVFSLGETSVRYEATDGDGNIGTCEFTITVKAPTIYGCPDRPIVWNTEADEGYATVTWVEPQILDQSADSILTSSYSSGRRFYIGNTTVTYMLHDNGPNVETCTFVVVVRDAEIPTFTYCPDSMETRVLSRVGCNIPFYWTVPAAQDNSGLPTITSTHQPGISRFGCGLTTVIYTATDGSGNVAFCKFNVTVKVGAYTNCPMGVTGDSTPGSFMGTVTWTRPSILDQNPDWTELVSHTPEQNFVIGTTNVTYRLSDLSGATDICWFLVTIRDVEPPVIRCPADIVATALGLEGGTTVSWPRLFTSDNAFISTTWSDHQPGEEFPVGVTVVTYHTNDTSGLTATCSFTVTVRDHVFTHFTQINDHVLTDRDDKVLNVSNVVDCLHACVDETEFLCKSAEVTSMECRLSSEAARMDSDLAPLPGVTYFQLLGDNTPPTLQNCPLSITRKALDGKSFADITWLTPTATDNSVEWPVTLTSTHQPGQNFPIGITRVVYTAVDEFFNEATCSFFISIIDDQNPIIEGCPSKITTFIHSEDETATAVSWNAPVALDNSGHITLTASQEPGTLFELGGTLITYMAVDPSGNQAECSFVIFVDYIEEDYRFTLQVIMSNLAYSYSLDDPHSQHYIELAENIENQVDDAFGQDETFLDAQVINITMLDGGGVKVTASVGFSERIYHESKTSEFDSLLQSLTTDGVLGADVDKILISEEGQHDGALIEIDECYILPCPNGMNCTVQDDRCVSYCEDNPTYCLNGGSCLKQSSVNLISCLCSSYRYHGTRCGAQDKVNGPRTVAIIFGTVWGVIFILLVLLCFPIAVRKCAQSSSGSNGSTTELVKPTTFTMEESDDDDDDEDILVTSQTSPEGPAVGTINPGFVGDEQGTSSSDNKLGGKENNSVIESTVINEESAAGYSMIEPPTKERSIGDGNSNISSETNGSVREEINLDVLSAVMGEKSREAENVLTQETALIHTSDPDDYTAIMIEDKSDLTASTFANISGSDGEQVAVKESSASLSAPEYNGNVVPVEEELTHLVTADVHSDDGNVEYRATAQENCENFSIGTQ